MPLGEPATMLEPFTPSAGLLARWRVLKRLLAAGRPALITYVIAMLIAGVAPDKHRYPEWSTAAMAVAMVLMTLTYVFGLRALRVWLTRVNMRSSYVSLWWSYLATTLLFQQPLWLICMRFGLIGSSNALDNAYFTLVTFLTIGYGDFVPHSGDGRIFAMVVGLLGAAHNICFVAYLLSLNQPKAA